ncbi:MAG: HEAT repeat domain-containing protein [Candidatus Riflebacteria bacterium]|nr:HEAT repeat domain-containing protein [Candidatus Riflebacteria bacterium]
MSVTIDYDLLEKELTASDEVTRLRAIKQIITLPEFAQGEVVRFVKALYAPLKDSSVAVRYYAKKAYSRLKRMVKGQDRHIILPALMDGDALKAATPAPTFVYGSRDYWLYELNSIDYKVRVKAVMEVCRFGTDTAFKKVCDLFDVETHEHVLATLVKYLPLLKRPGIFERIVPYLNHPDWRVRANTVEGLENLGDARAIPLVMPFLSDQDNRVKGNAVKYLVKSHPDEVRKALAEMLASPHEWMRDSAVLLASKIDLSVSEDLLLAALKDPSPEIVRKAIAALEVKAKSQTVMNAFDELATSPDESVRTAAAAAKNAMAKRL